MIPFFKKRRPATVLGLSLDGNRLEAVVLRRNNGLLQVQQSLSTPLALSPLSGDPELVGREIRNHLDQAGIRERRCVVCLPLNWVLTVQTKVPELAGEDLESFLQIEAERGFPSGHENLHLANSRARASTGEQYATLLGIPRNHISVLEQALKAAQLKPVSFSIGIAAMAGGPENHKGCLTLALGPQGIDLEVSVGGGIAALRSLDGAVETEGAQRRIDADVVAREIRITLGQLPPAIAKEITVARIIGRGDIARQFLADIAQRAESMGLRAELLDRVSEAQFNSPPPVEIAHSPALALADAYLRDQPGLPEFLPPKVQPWQQFLNSSQMSSKKLVWAGSAAGAAAAFVILAFLYQQWRISRLESHWRSIEPKVTAIQASKDQIQKFRPWYDPTFRGLRILRELTEAFPEDGVVSAKSLEIRDLATVTCSGIARDNQAYLALFDKLQVAPDVANLKTEMERGQSPIQFTFNFVWQEGAGATNGN